MYFGLPDEILAVAAKCRLLEEARDEIMTFNLVDVFLTESAPTVNPAPTVWD